MSPTDSKRPDPDDYASVTRWAPLVVPLFALLPALSAYFVVGILMRSH